MYNNYNIMDPLLGIGSDSSVGSPDEIPLTQHIHPEFGNVPVCPVAPYTVEDDGLFTLANGQIIDPITYNDSQWYNNNYNNNLTALRGHVDSSVHQLPRFTLKYLKFPQKIYKVQKRIKGKSEQRIENGELKITLDFHEVKVASMLKSIEVFVKRTKEFPNTYKYIGAVPLAPKIVNIQPTQYLVTVNLDHVFEINGRKVYELQKTLMEELNSFHLIVRVLLLDGQHIVEKSNEFLLVGKRYTNAKRRRDSTSSDDLLWQPEVDHSTPSQAPSQTPSQTLPVDDDVFRARKIVTDHVQTKTLEIDGTLISNCIQTPNGDIAYHFLLENCDEVFDEGEVVGIETDEFDNTPKISKLTASNALKVILKGVITRSQYLEAQRPPKGVRSETVCMMGIVPVKVLGPVSANDPLYASQHMPGVTVSRKLLSIFQQNEACMIGYSFESKSSSMVGLVEAGVSVLNTASQALLNQRINSMTEYWTSKIFKLKLQNKRSRQRLLCCGIISLCFLILLAVLLWQLLVSGTAYRYFLCKRGAINEENTVQFNYRPRMDKFNYPLVEGLEFKFDVVMEKLGHRDYPRLNDTRARYYLNVDLCAFGGVRNTQDLTTGKRRVNGQDVFAVDANCTHVYFFFQVLKIWLPVKKMSWVKSQCG